MVAVGSNGAVVHRPVVAVGGVWTRSGCRGRPPGTPRCAPTSAFPDVRSPDICVPVQSQSIRGGIRRRGERQWRENVMRYDPARHHRQSYRLLGHDYAAGGTYFVTLVTVDRACLFGDIHDSAMRLNALGSIVDRAWARAGEIRPEIAIDGFAVMPNHLHGLMTITPVITEPAVGCDTVFGFDTAVGCNTVGAHRGVPNAAAYPYDGRVRCHRSLRSSRRRQRSRSTRRPELGASRCGSAGFTSTWCETTTILTGSLGTSSPTRIDGKPTTRTRASDISFPPGSTSPKLTT
jgi:hypothetical protein